MLDKYKIRETIAILEEHKCNIGAKGTVDCDTFSLINALDEAIESLNRDIKLVDLTEKWTEAHDSMPNFEK